MPTKFSDPEFEVVTVLNGDEMIAGLNADGDGNAKWSNSTLKTWILEDAPGASTQLVKVSLTSAEILNLNSVPKQIVAAQGAGKIVMPLRIIFYNHFGTTAYTTNVNFKIAPGTLFDTTLAGVIGQGTDQLSTYTLLTAGGSSTPSSSINVPINLFCTSANPLAGDGTLDVYLLYSVITV